MDAANTLSEKLARVASPTVDGSMDYVGFGSTDTASLGWSRRLFLDYCQRADPERPKGYPSPSDHSSCGRRWLESTGFFAG